MASSSSLVPITAKYPPEISACVSPKDVKTMDIYKGVLPFVLIQLLFLLYLFLNPDFIYIVPELISGYKS